MGARSADGHQKALLGFDRNDSGNFLGFRRGVVSSYAKGSFVGASSGVWRKSPVGSRVRHRAARMERIVA